MVSVRISFKTLCNCFSIMKSNWLRNEDGRRIMKNYANFGKRASYLQLIISFCIIILYISNPIILKRKNASNLPFQTICEFNNPSQISYHFLYATESLGWIYLVLSYIGVDLLFLGIVMHLCGQLKIFQIELSNIGVWTKLSDYSQQITKLVEQHGKLIKLMKDLEVTFNMILWFQFVLSTFLVTSQSKLNCTMLIAFP